MCFTRLTVLLNVRFASYNGFDTFLNSFLRAILIGSLIPLVMYSVWDAVFLGIVPYSPESMSKDQVVQALGGQAGRCVYMYVCVCMYVCMCACMYVYVYIKHTGRVVTRT
jgi:hypothetical protein